jgi:hypothetical protein
MTTDASSNQLLPADSTIAARLIEVAHTQRMVFFAGLPGVGKSLLIRELAQMAHSLGRRVHLLQWDVARQGFLSNAMLAKYPDAAGVTHFVVRKSMGIWSRKAVFKWSVANPGTTDLLITEAPLIGNRFVELAVPGDDKAESILIAENSCFIIPVPTRKVRIAIKAARVESTRNPRHPRERGDAQPNVMDAVWAELSDAATRLGLGSRSHKIYNPDTYKEVYLAVLKYRKCVVLPIDIVIATGNSSVYTLQIPFHDVLPTITEAKESIAEVERTYPVLASLEGKMACWYIV